MTLQNDTAAGDIYPSLEQTEVIEHCRDAYLEVQTALGDLCVALLADRKLEVLLLNDRSSHLNERIKRITDFLISNEYYDELGHARVLYGAIGVSSETLHKVYRLNSAKQSLAALLPGGDAVINGLSFNRIIANWVEPDMPRLNWLAVTRQTRVIERVCDRVDGQGRMSLKALRVSVQSNYKAERMSLEDLYYLVGSIAETGDRQAAFKTLPSASDNEEENYVIKRDTRVRPQGVVNLSYWLAQESRVFSRNVKTSTPVFYDVEGPPLRVEASRSNQKSREPEDDPKRFLFEWGGYAFYRPSKTRQH